MGGWVVRGGGGWWWWIYSEFSVLLWSKALVLDLRPRPSWTIVVRINKWWFWPQTTWNNINFWGVGYFWAFELCQIVGRKIMISWDPHKLDTRKKWSIGQGSILIVWPWDPFRSEKRCWVYFVRFWTKPYLFWLKNQCVPILKKELLHIFKLPSKGQTWELYFWVQEAFSLTYPVPHQISKHLRHCMDYGGNNLASINSELMKTRINKVFFMIYASII